MHGYLDINRSTTHCVSFIDSDQVDASDRELADEVRSKCFRVAYVDCAEYADRPWQIGSAIGFALGADHAPYHEGQVLNLTRWLNDLISLSGKAPGLVIVLDNAGPVFAMHRKHFTDLIEAFLLQLHHWLEQELPCHFCLQMSPNPLVAEFFQHHDHGAQPVTPG